MKIEARPMSVQELPLMMDYFYGSDEAFLTGMGADKSKLPPKSTWIQRLTEDMNQGFESREFYYILWLKDDRAIGHSNINNIHFGQSATMHLHLWHNSTRQKGLGLKLLKKTIPQYFTRFELEVLVCEPYAHNQAPNRAMLRLGFNHIDTYDTTPGPINFYQTVNRYELTKKRYNSLSAAW